MGCIGGHGVCKGCIKKMILYNTCRCPIDNTPFVVPNDDVDLMKVHQLCNKFTKPEASTLLLKRLRLESEPYEPSSSSSSCGQSETCDTHNGRELTLVCKACQKILCSQCQKESHMNCGTDVIPAWNEFTYRQIKIKNCIAKADHTMKTLEDKEKDLREFSEKLTGCTAVNLVNQAYDSLIERVEEALKKNKESLKKNIDDRLSSCVAKTMCQLDTILAEKVDLEKRVEKFREALLLPQLSLLKTEVQDIIVPFNDLEHLIDVEVKIDTKSFDNIIELAESICFNAPENVRKTIDEIVSEYDFTPISDVLDIRNEMTIPLENLKNPIGLALWKPCKKHPEGLLFVADVDNKRVCIFNATTFKDPRYLTFQDEPSWVSILLPCREVPSGSLFISFTVVVITSGGDAGVTLFPGLGRQLQLVVSVSALVAF